MSKRIGWRDCDIRIECSKENVACAMLASLCKTEGESPIRKITADFLALPLQHNILPGALFYLGFLCNFNIDANGTSYYSVEPRDKCMIYAESVVLPLLAPVINKGSKITFEIAPAGEFVRYYFDGKKCITEKGALTFPSDKQYVVLKEIFDGYDRGPAAIIVGSYPSCARAAVAFHNEVLAERIELRNGKYPANLQENEDAYDLIWVASEVKDGKHWPVVQISVQETTGIAKRFEAE